jgi:phenylalanyl-tRNA synthetase beta chain
MRLPLNLVRRYVDHDIAPARLAELLNNRVSEVEVHERAPSAASFADVRVGRITRRDPFGSEHVRLDLDLGPDRPGFQVVVGAAHDLREGMGVACVAAGARLPDGTLVAARDLAGGTSHGMLLSEAELGIGGDRAHVITFPPEVTPGTAVHDALALDEDVLEFDLEPHRPDLFSLAGFAREIAAQGGTRAHLPAGDDPSRWPALPPERLRVEIEDARLVRRYVGVRIRGLTNGPSPMWLQNALRKLGMRPLNRIVDVTNLVLAEQGQPLHAFDARRVTTNLIRLRGARPAETVTTLDGATREMPPGTVLVCDGDAPIAVAGIMGDAHSEVREDTHEIVLESATFDMFAVRRASRLLGLRTESSLRFEKGLSQASALRGAARAALLLREVCGTGVAVEGCVDARGVPDPEVSVRVSVARLSKRLGVPIRAADVHARLVPLGLDVHDHDHDGGADADTDALTVRIPDFRPDLRIPEDIEEEVARVGGYEHIPSTLPVMSAPPPRWSDFYRWAPRVRARLTAHGLSEVYLMGWLGRDEIARYRLPAERLLELRNTLSSDWTHFRTTSLPHVLAAVRENLKDYDDAALFEIGKIYFARAAGEPDGGDGPVGESRRLCAAVTASPRDPDAAYRRVRGIAADLLAHLRIAGARAVWGDEVTGLPWHLRPDHYHPRRFVALRADDAWLGLAGELHPELADAAEIRRRVGVIEIALDPLLARARADVTYVAPPRFPSVELHANVLCPERLFIGRVLDVVRGAGEAWLHRVDVLNVYRGENVAAGRKQVTLAFAFNAGDRSLRQEEALEALVRLAAAVARAGLDATLEVPR